MKHLLKLALLLAILFQAGYAGPWIQGNVIKVSDGDTFQMIAGGKKYKIRLMGVDCPESKQEYGPESKSATANLILGKEVKVEILDTDRYGRIVGDVWIGKTHLNYWLVSGGNAWWYSRYAPHRKDLQAAEQSARNARLGLWKNPKPTPPWDWRSEKRSKQSKRKR